MDSRPTELLAVHGYARKIGNATRPFIVHDLGETTTGVHIIIEVSWGSRLALNLITDPRRCKPVTVMNACQNA